MKLKDFNQSIKLFDAEVVSLTERLQELDPTTDEYKRVDEIRKNAMEEKQIAIRNKADYLSGLIPQWGTAIFSTLFGTYVAVKFGKKVLDVEANEGVVSTSAINLWDKVIRKF